MDRLPIDINDLQKGLIDKDYSAVDLVDTYLSRINNLNDKLNVFITISDELAYKQAKIIDDIIAKEKDPLKSYPLLGVVYSAKDLYLTKGIRTTAGSKALESYVPAYSSTVVKRMDDAGAIMIGKTNCDAWGHGASGENSDFGNTKNPWDLTRVPGGSSSGSAVSVAAQMGLVSLGTDTGGSIRLPANFCNVVGLKPTYGVVPRYGVTAMASSLDTIGNLASSVEDSKKVFNVMSGKDNFDSTLSNKSGKISNKRIVIGLPKEYFQDGISPGVASVIEEVKKVYENLEYEFKEVSIPTTKYSVAVYYIIMPAETSSNLARYDGVRYGSSRQNMGDEARRRIMLGSYVLSAGYYDAYYLKAAKVRSKISDDFEKAFKEVDLLMTPVNPDIAFKLGENTEDPLKMYLADVFTTGASLAGLPAISIPAGFSKGNLPVGFQLIAPKFSEKILFKVGQDYQSITNWHKQKPIL